MGVDINCDVLPVPPHQYIGMLFIAAIIFFVAVAMHRLCTYERDEIARKTLEVDREVALKYAKLLERILDDEQLTPQHKQKALYDWYEKVPYSILKYLSPKE